MGGSAAGVYDLVDTTEITRVACVGRKALKPVASGACRARARLRSLVFLCGAIGSFFAGAAVATSPVGELALTAEAATMVRDAAAFALSSASAYVESARAELLQRDLF